MPINWNTVWQLDLMFWSRRQVDWMPAGFRKEPVWRRRGCRGSPGSKAEAFGPLCDIDVKRNTLGLFGNLGIFRVLKLLDKIMVFSFRLIPIVKTDLVKCDDWVHFLFICRWIVFPASDDHIRSRQNAKNNFTQLSELNETVAANSVNLFLFCMPGGIKGRIERWACGGVRRGFVEFQLQAICCSSRSAFLSKDGSRTLKTGVYVKFSCGFSLFLPFRVQL